MMNTKEQQMKTVELVFESVMFMTGVCLILIVTGAI
jgi:hypothetical protein